MPQRWTPEKKILDIGCGLNRQPGSFGVDLRGNQKHAPHDLNNLPWPIHDNWFYVVYALQILEHLDEPVKIMEEIWRICMPGALVFIQVPNGSCPGYDQDPTHKHPWNLGTFLYFCPSQWPKHWGDQVWSAKAKFKILHYDLVTEAGRTPWGSYTFADNLTVILQAIKGSD